jgi:TolA-binding protein
LNFKALILAASALVAAPVLAQSNPTLDQRVGKVEKQLKAVQRKVFPNGEPIEPETGPAAATPGGAPVQSPIADLTARVDAIEKSLAALTGQVETQGNRIRVIEDQLKTMPQQLPTAAAPVDSASVAGDTAEPPPPEVIQQPVRRPVATTPPVARPSPNATAAGARTTAARAQAVAAIEVPATGDAAEDMYSYGFRLYQAQLFPEAEAQLKDYATKYPRGKRVSFARNLLGRAYLDDNKPALASMAFLDNYQKNAQGERAAESLSWLGTSLIRLGKKPDACRVYDEFDDVYGAKAPVDIRARVTRGRSEAGCAK